MPEIWFTSDTHFGHQRIIELCDRPFDSVEEMNEALVTNWNLIVARNDIVFHLGDFIMGTFMENVAIIERLNGSIHLFPGNHDRMSSVYHAKEHKKAAWTDEYVSRGVAIHPEVLYGWPSWDINVSHYPYTGDSQDQDRYAEMRPEDNGNWLLHGHVHDSWKVNGRMINVGVDVWDYSPVHMDQIKEIIDAR